MKKYWPVGITLIIQILFLFSPYIAVTSGWWAVSTPEDVVTKFAEFVGVQLLLMTTALTLVVKLESAELNQHLKDTLERTKGARVVRVSDERFYRDFLHAAENAEHTVRIAYFAPYPPEDEADSKRKKYYVEVERLMKQSKTVHFKRLLRSTPRNDEWMAELARELTGRPRANLALLHGDLPADSAMPLALSIQVIDERVAWLVAISSHQRDGEFRDVYIEDETVAHALSTYYQRLWSAADEILNAGVLTEAGRLLLERFPKQA